MELALKSTLVHLPARNWYRVLFKFMFRSIATCINVMCLTLIAFIAVFLFLFVNDFKITQMALKSTLVHLPARNWYRVLFKVMFRSLATCISVMCLPLYAFMKEKSWNSQQSAQNEVCFSNYHGVCWMLQQCGVPWVIGEVSVHFLIHTYDGNPLII
jgi:hypothetical protein